MKQPPRRTSKRRRQQPKPPADPVAAHAATKLGASVTDITDSPPTNAELKASIDKMRTWASGVAKKLGDFGKMLQIGLYDPEAQALLEVEMRESEVVLRAYPSARRATIKDLEKLNGGLRDLSAQLDDVTRPVRMEENSLDNDGKKKHPNLDAVGDAVTARLRKSTAHQNILKALDAQEIEIALKKADLQELDAERKAVSKLHFGQVARLNNLTARINANIPGGNEHE